MSRDIAEWLAIGTAHPVDPANVGKGTGPARWEFADAGWALAGLPTHMELLLRVKYMGEPDYHLRADVVAMARMKVMFWRRVAPDTTLAHAREVAEVAVRAFCMRSACTVCNNQACPICGGEQEVLCEYCCRHCGGSGIEPYWSWKQAALSTLHGPRADMERLYDELMAMLSRWEGKGLRTVRRRVAAAKVKVNSQVRGA